MLLVCWCFCQINEITTWPPFEWGCVHLTLLGSMWLCVHVTTSCHSTSVVNHQGNKQNCKLKVHETNSVSCFRDFKLHYVEHQNCIVLIVNKFSVFYNNILSYLTTCQIHQGQDSVLFKELFIHHATVLRIMRHFDKLFSHLERQWTL